MRSNLESWKEVRRQVLTNQLSKRGACEKYGLGWRTLEKILAHSEPLGYRQSQPRPRPKIDPFLPVIHQILVDDRQAPKKQLYTAWRILERLRHEHQFRGRYTIIKDAVRRRVDAPLAVHCPLTITCVVPCARQHHSHKEPLHAARSGDDQRPHGHGLLW